MYQPASLLEALEALGNVLEDQGVQIALAVIGGGALVLARLGARSTEDIDVVGLLEEDRLVTAEPLPDVLRDAVAAIAGLYGLRDGWLNAGPTSLLRQGLPDGYLQRCTTVRFGGLSLLVASRLDQIHLKLYAMEVVDDKHHQDLRNLRPNAAELLDAARWIRRHTSGEGADMELRAKLRLLGIDVDA